MLATSNLFYIFEFRIYRIDYGGHVFGIGQLFFVAHIASIGLPRLTITRPGRNNSVLPLRPSPEADLKDTLPSCPCSAQPTVYTLPWQVKITKWSAPEAMSQQVKPGKTSMGKRLLPSSVKPMLPKQAECESPAEIFNTLPGKSMGRGSNSEPSSLLSRPRAPSSLQPNE
ncbi:hypothetical protein FF38_05984 [Lucilia cuprina]|uniref:Uncharacterized protein n=1 Tax=Lucilia cuprina TaxID=7375 RepID=A0A0L0CPM6_LUCCU|nr:hypothetical protein FF38_05984 [Lucilia cuprina]